MIFHKYKKIWALGKEEVADIFTDPEDDVAIEEKIDGGNFRYYITEHGEVVVGSRNNLLDLKGNNTKNFWRCSEFVKEKLYAYGTENLKKFGNYIFYGECCIKHTLNYDWEKIPPFLGFDIYDCEQERFLEYNVVKEIFEKLGLPQVPLVKICKAKDITEVTDDTVPVSAYAPVQVPNQQAEGIVFKNYTKQLYAKYVRVQFKEENRQTFGGCAKHATNDEEKVALKYCPNARIDKAIFKLVDEGMKLELSMMAKLPMLVWNDLWEENWKEIIRQKWKLDLNQCKKVVTTRCLKVLNQCITNNQFAEKPEEDDHEEGTCIFCGCGLQDWDTENACMKCN